MVNEVWTGITGETPKSSTMDISIATATFATLAEAQTWKNDKEALSEGQTILVDGELLKKQAGATGIPGLDDFVVTSYAKPKMFGVVDGISDGTQIQAALDYMRNNYSGGECRLDSNKEYIITGPLDLPDNPKIKGGPGTKIKVADGVNSNMIASSERLDGGQLENCTIEGIEFDANEGNNPQDGNWYSIFASYGFKNLLIADCTFRNCRGYAFGAQSYPNQPSGYTGEQENIRIERCLFEDVGLGDGLVDGQRFDAIDMKSGLWVSIVGNTIRRCGKDGIDVRARGGYITDNVIENPGESCIQLKGNSFGEDVKGEFYVAGNRGLGGDYGLWIADGNAITPNIVTVKSLGNYWFNQAESGIVLTQSAVDSIRLKSTSDEIKGSGSHGINILAASLEDGSVEFASPTVTGCGGSGILSKGDYVRVRGGELNGSTGYGYEEGSGGANSLLSEVDLQGNTAGAVFDNGALAARDCLGYRQGGRYVTGNILVDNVGTESISIAHGLDITPAEKDISVSLHKASTNAVDFDFGPRFVSRSATNITVAVDVENAAPAGAWVRAQITVHPREWT